MARPAAIFRGNLARQGYYPDASVPDRVTVDWEVAGVNKTDYTAAKASPVQTPAGDLVVPGDTGSLYSVSPQGTVNWAVATRPSTHGIHGTPVVANGTVYVGAYDGAMYAFDAASGRQRWRTTVGGSIGASPAYVDGTVYIAVEFPEPSGSVVALDAGTGQVVWEDDRIQDHPHSTPAIDLAADRLVVGANDGYLYAWTFGSREFAWKFNTGRPIKGPIATYDGAAFFGSWDYNVYRVDLRSGTEDWDRSFTTGYNVMSGPAIDPSTDTVYVGSHDNHLYALDANAGELRWSYETESDVLGCPTIAGDRVLFGSEDTHLYALEKRTGEYVWDVPNDGWVTSTPIVGADGGIYYTERAGEEGDGSLVRLAGVE